MAMESESTLEQQDLAANGINGHADEDVEMNDDNGENTANSSLPQTDATPSINGIHEPAPTPIPPPADLSNPQNLNSASLIQQQPSSEPLSYPIQQTSSASTSSPLPSNSTQNIQSSHNIPTSTSISGPAVPTTPTATSTASTMPSKDQSHNNHHAKETPALSPARASTPLAGLAIKEVYEHGSPTRVYLNTKVGPVLLEGMKFVAKHEPEKPLKWLSEFLAARSRDLEGE